MAADRGTAFDAQRFDAPMARAENRALVRSAASMHPEFEPFHPPPILRRAQVA
jgi:hypothetical protein